MIPINNKCVHSWNIEKTWDAGADTDLDPHFFVYFDRIVL